MTSRLRLLIALTSACVLSAVPARADTRTTAFTSFLHNGPGRGYAVIDEVPVQTTVEVGQCQNGFCQVRYGNSIGWLNQRIITMPVLTASPTAPSDCADFARTGWPNGGDLDRLCLEAPGHPRQDQGAAKP